MDLLSRIVAEASDRFVRALERRDREAVERALRETVEGTLPDPRMPKRRVRDIRNGNPHQMWRWVGRDGMVSFLVEVWNWNAIELSVYVTSLATRQVYRDVGRPDALVTMLTLAVRHLDGA